MLKRLLYKASSKLSFRLNNQYGFPNWVSYEPELIPPFHLMQMEGIQVLEEWFRWAEEWSFLLRMYGKISPESRVLEIGCGLGRTAFPLRYILTQGSYDGFEISSDKVEFLQKNFTKQYPNFRFILADIHNTFYNPAGEIQAETFKFPYPDSAFDIVYAASIFTHMLPDITEHYFKETARVLQKNGRAVFSFFILDNYRAGHTRPFGFAHTMFDLDHSYGSYGDSFKIANPANVEEMTAYKISLLEQFAKNAGLVWVQEPVAGMWSGITDTWVGTQDIVVLRKE
jgi:SAM-dependent methyltransferase